MLPKRNADIALYRHTYVFGVLAAALLAWCYWEWVNPNYEWWALDGYPTWVAAKLWWAGQGAAIYQPELWIPDGGSPGWKRLATQLGIPNGGTSFVYHPLYLMALSPLIVDLTVSQFTHLLLLINAISVGIIFAESIRLAQDKIKESDKWLVLVLVCVSFPALSAAFLGQNVLPTLALLLVGYRLLAHRRFWLAALPLAFAVAMKAWVLPVAVLAYLLHGRVATLIGAATFCALLILVPWLIDAALLSSYLDIASRLSKILVYPYNNASLRAMFERFMNPEWSEFAFKWIAHEVSPMARFAEMFVQASIVSLALMLWWWKRPSRDQAFVAALCLLLILPGVCWTHYFIFTFPVASFLFLNGVGVYRWLGLFSLLYLALPWHSLPGVWGYLRWPTLAMIGHDPTGWNWVISLPILIFIVVGMVALTVPRHRLSD